MRRILYNKISKNKLNLYNTILYEKSSGKLYQTTNPTLFSRDNYEPIGIVVIPTSHDVYGTGECCVISLMSASLTTPDTGQTTDIGIVWGASGVDYSDLNIYNKVGRMGTMNNNISSKLDGESEFGLVPMMNLNMNTKCDCPHDSQTKYYNSTNASYGYVPSPYLDNGIRNPDYYKTDLPVSIHNATSDFNGKSNTEFLCAKATSQSDWKSSTILNYTTAGYHPAACACWRFHTVGTNQGDWYLPAAGEMGYIMSRFDKINEIINILQIHFDKPLCTLSLSAFLTSSIFSSTDSRSISFQNGIMGHIGKTQARYVRPVLKGKFNYIKIPEYKMTLEEKIGQLFIVRPSISGSDTEFNDNMKSIIDQYHPAGILLKGANIKTKDQLTKYINAYKAYDTLKPLIISDEEGGVVARVAKSGILPASQTSFGYSNAHAVGNTGDVNNAIHMGDVIGKYLSGLGINGDYAPVADINSNPNNPIIGTRAFGDTPARVTEMVVGFLEGMAPHNVLTCLKHFPGHGDTSTDTHTEAAIVTKTWEQMLECEIIPFKENMHKTDMIMVAHIIAQNIDPDTPASISYEIITNKLRNELGYNGIVTTDGMEMAAITNDHTAGEAALAAIKAGCDMICCPSDTGIEGLLDDFVNAYNAILNAVKSGEITEARIDESVNRIMKAKNKVYSL